MTAFAPLLGLLADVPDPRRGQGQLYKLPHVLLFSILAIVTGCNSYRGIVTFIDVHRHKLNATFGLRWRRAPAYTAVRYILKGLDPADVEMAFRRHAALLQAARATPGKGSIALDGKTLRGSFDNFRDRAASQVLSAFATDTSLVLAHIDIDVSEHERRVGGKSAEHLHGGTVVEVVEATPERFAIQRNAALPGRGAGGLQQGGVAAERHLHVGGIEALENIPNRRVGGGATPF